MLKEKSLIMKSKEEAIQDSRNRIDEYLNTLYAIIGFLNTYKFEIQKNQGDIAVFQGRKLFTDADRKNYVTPDLGLVMSTGFSVVGEVKYSFPSNQEFWKSTFEQLKKYDSITTGWPNDSGEVSSYDIVLLVHQSRSRAVVKYYIDQLSPEEKISKVFAVVEFNRSSQGQEYFHFRLEHGTLSYEPVNNKLYTGLLIPMTMYVSDYATIKINDVEPPMPLLLHLCYECIIDKLTGEGKYKKLTKKTKIEVIITLPELTQRLREVYSFKSLQSKKFDSGQPEFPKSEWVRKALDKLSAIGEGKWTDLTSKQFTYILTQKNVDILSHYIQQCSVEQFVQPDLFG